MTAVLDEFAFYLALDEEEIAFRVVTADLALGAAQEAIVAHPVGQLVGEPRAALGAVIVGAGGAHFQRELLLPVHALGNVGNAESVLDADARVRVDQPPGELVGADVKPPRPARRR